MAIEASQPEVIPATDEKTFDKWVISHAEISGNYPDYQAAVTLLRCRTTDEGTLETLPTSRVIVPIDDLIGRALGGDTDIAEWLELTFSIVQRLGTEQGLL